MNYLIEDDNFLTEEEKKYIKEQSIFMPFYIQNQSRYGKETNPMMCHLLVKRLEDNLDSKDRTSSNYLNFFLNILIRFTKKYNLSFGRILRGCINVSYPFNINFKQSEIHIDHEIPHNNFILYYGEDMDGDLLLYNNDKKLIKKVKPKNFKIVCFGDRNYPVFHSFEYPKKKFRTAVVFTFD